MNKLQRMGKKAHFYVWISRNGDGSFIGEILTSKNSENFNTLPCFGTFSGAKAWMDFMVMCYNG